MCAHVSNPAFPNSHVRKSRPGVYVRVFKMTGAYSKEESHGNGFKHVLLAK
jgi:hypothetical protein